jgi:hypothetical protein
LAEGEDFERCARRMGYLCEEFGTSLKREKGFLSIEF